METIPEDAENNPSDPQILKQPIETTNNLLFRKIVHYGTDELHDIQTAGEQGNVNSTKTNMQSEDAIPVSDTRLPILENNRTCTDIKWLFIFGGLVSGWLLMGFYVGGISKTESLLSTYNLYKTECSSEEAVDKPYTLYFNLTGCLEGTKTSSVTDIYILSKYCNSGKVCVAQCPHNYWTMKPFLTHLQPFNRSLIEDNLLCVTEEIKNNITTLEELEDAINRNLCMEENMFNVQVSNLCMPSSLINKIVSKKDIPGMVFHILEYLYLCVLEYWISLLVILTVLSFLVFIYVCSLHWILVPIALMSIIGITSTEIIGCVFLLLCYFGEIEIPATLKLKMLNLIGKHNKVTIILAVILGILATIKIFNLIRLRRYIMAGFTLIKESSKAIADISGSLLFIFLSIYIYYAIVGIAWTIMICLTSYSNPSYRIEQNGTSACNCTTGVYYNAAKGDHCLPENFAQLCLNCSCFEHKEVPFFLSIILHLINCFAFIWNYVFIFVFSKLVLAYTFCRWYYTVEKKTLPFFIVIFSTGNILRYHLGTAAYGSLGVMLTSVTKGIELLKHVSMIIPLVETVTKKFIPSQLVKLLSLEHLQHPENLNGTVRRISCRIYTYSFIMCALKGTDFRNSTKNLGNIIIESNERKKLHQVVHKMLTVIKWVIQMSVSFLIFLKLYEKMSVNLAICLIVVVCGLYLISAVYTQVYLIAADTLIFCYLHDVDNCRSEIKKSYVIPKNLKSILKKKKIIRKLRNLNSSVAEINE